MKAKCMSRTKPDKSTGGPGGVYPMGKVKKTSFKQAGSVELTRTNWRHKTKEDPRAVEMRSLLGGAFANL